MFHRHNILAAISGRRARSGAAGWWTTTARNAWLFGPQNSLNDQIAANHATAQGNAALGGSPNALQLDGVSDYCTTVETGLTYVGTAWQIIAWVNPDPAVHDQTVLRIAGSAPDTDAGMTIDHSGLAAGGADKAFALGYDNDWADSHIYSTTTVNDGWHMAMAGFDGTRLWAGADGVWEASEVVDAAPNIRSTLAWTIGSYGPNPNISEFKGAIGEIWLFDEWNDPASLSFSDMFNGTKSYYGVA